MQVTYNDKDDRAGLRDFVQLINTRTHTYTPVLRNQEPLRQLIIFIIENHFFRVKTCEKKTHFSISSTYRRKHLLCTLA